MTDQHHNDEAALRAVEHVMSKVRPPADRRRRFHDEYLRLRDVDDDVIKTHWAATKDRDDT